MIGTIGSLAATPTSALPHQPEVDVGTNPPTQEQVDRFEYDERLIPPKARRSTRYRVSSYEWLPDPQPSTIESVIASEHEVVADIPGHCVLLVGYDRDTRQYIIKDSAHSGQFQRLSYDSGAGVLAGHYITAVHPPTAPRNRTPGGSVDG